MLAACGSATGRSSGDRTSDARTSDVRTSDARTSDARPSGAPATAAGPTLDADSADGPALAAAVQQLARARLAQRGPDDTEPGLRERVLLQAAAGDPAGALASLAALRTFATPADPTRKPVMYMADELHARARLAVAAGRGSFADALAAAFREVYRPLDDLAAVHASWFLGYDLDRARRELTQSLDRLRGVRLADLTPVDAVELVTRHASYAIYRDLAPLAPALRAEDDQRRYQIDDDVRFTARDGAELSAIVVRPRRLTGPQPTVLFSTIYTDRAAEQAVLSAAHGYIGVTAFPRGKWKSRAPIAPYEHDADDTRDAIDWIARQPWSDHRVAMYGGSYAGFTQWASLKRPHPALKTIVPYVAAIPGQGLPMENNVFINANYGWAFYVSNGPLDDNQVYFDPARWRALPAAWFTSGRPYRELDRVDGTPSPLLQRWLRHPAYDAYWQAMVPVGAELARIDIPILTVTGYYDDGQISALRYLTEHLKQRPGAPHYLLIGPYDHFGAQRRPSPVLRGYAIDPVAQIDTIAITFAWIDHVLRAGPMPALLADRINYQVMGANQWRHAPSIERMASERLTLYLDDHHLVPRRPTRPGFVAQDIDLADRNTQTNSYYPDPIVSDQLDDGGGAVFVGEPLAEPLSIDGIVTGELRATINKRDMDFGVELYEQTPDGKYLALTYYLGRASHARDLTARRLLTPGVATAIPFERTRMVSRQLARGSRLVVVVAVNKNAFAQVNHGTGKDVSDESVADAGAPLHVQWHADSFVRIPIRR
jgi:putative CocE/NonD family hydrolase